MTSARSYRRPLTFDEAVAEVERGAGNQFDPRMSEAFVEACTGGRINDLLPAELALTT
jgi:HD-GYP domain-containing protein (c-di-GMP phosphodiesterase class II)